jgi:predicted aspartyl protease
MHSSNNYEGNDSIVLLSFQVNTMSAPGVTTTVASEVAQGQRGEVQTTIYETKVKGDNEEQLIKIINNL